MNVEFYEPAFIEYNESIDFYNLQIESLWEKFITEIDNTITLIKKYPKSFPEYKRHTGKAVVNIFPYNIIYTIHKHYIEILAIAHQYRKPTYWLNR